MPCRRPSDRSQACLSLLTLLINSLLEVMIVVCRIFLADLPGRQGRVLTGFLFSSLLDNLTNGKTLGVWHHANHPLWHRKVFSL
ncbi:hypothetical protein QBC42DRAFT_261218 [Cladorrhinum samala]|uniref:Secreted protein n=1 Tax=Cladorrhinum samala TaxID=585594 RepID=A0AAV9HX76_9PEZI|nr:hypothetical protein QBC42DRAFT_261218 [Cladorrhinum samala]